MNLYEAMAYSTPEFADHVENVLKDCYDKSVHGLLHKLRVADMLHQLNGWHSQNSWADRDMIHVVHIDKLAETVGAEGPEGTHVAVCYQPADPAQSHESKDYRYFAVAWNFHVRDKKRQEWTGPKRPHDSYCSCGGDWSKCFDNPKVYE